VNGKFIIYALLVALFSSMASWGKFIGSSGSRYGGMRGSSWYSDYGGGGSWGGGAGGHK